MKNTKVENIPRWYIYKFNLHNSFVKFWETACCISAYLIGILRKVYSEYVLKNFPLVLICAIYIFNKLKFW